MRVLVVDDEAPARRRLVRMLRGAADMRIVGEAASGHEAIEAIAALAPDVVFLDVQMPELDGFEVIEEVGVDQMPTVVFVTAYDEYAIRAFEVRALDYLLKPFPPERLDAVLARLREELARRRPADLQALVTAMLGEATGQTRPLERLLVHEGERARLLPVDRIDWVEAAGNYVRIHTSGTSALVRRSIASLAARLDPSQFLRINRSAIVRLDAIRELQPWFHGDYRVRLHDGTELIWSRRFRAKDAQMFG